MFLCPLLRFFFFFFNDTATTEIYTLSLHDALPISPRERESPARPAGPALPQLPPVLHRAGRVADRQLAADDRHQLAGVPPVGLGVPSGPGGIRPADPVFRPRPAGRGFRRPAGPARRTGGDQLDCRRAGGDRKSTRLNSSHLVISYAVFCLKKKKKYNSNCSRQKLT